MGGVGKMQLILLAVFAATLVAPAAADVGGAPDARERNDGVRRSLHRQVRRRCQNSSAPDQPCWIPAAAATCRSPALATAAAFSTAPCSCRTFSSACSCNVSPL
ncbi:hypothetical protein DIPPA_63324 [Diplonema papillatum]|nr:hypothetical protein DIPPA_63322 [Diplonema papillatum]KAJ9446769.1 hypothetical protein DIPPA_55384 [Diplonema papillatum]KAJ9447825.1 hypothetical protein DIPPA_63324 [Diplonema papillatum]